MAPSDKLFLNHLARFVSDHKKEFVFRVLNERTRYVTLVLENIYQSQNASAALRTAECMGIQDVHIVENTARYQLNVRVLKGADKWLTLVRHRKKGINNTAACFELLRANGYRILVADPAADGISIDDMDVAGGKMAIVFGNELHGASEYARDHADLKVRIPMYGFTESLNISVSVAISLNIILRKLRQSSVDMSLQDQERESIMLNWYKKIVRRSDVLEREFLRTNQ